MFEILLHFSLPTILTYVSLLLMKNTQVESYVYPEVISEKEEKLKKVGLLTTIVSSNVLWWLFAYHYFMTV